MMQPLEPQPGLHPLKWLFDICTDPEHEPPSHLYIPPGYSYTHICPSCGRQVLLTPPVIWC
jgi:hypothetical protein